MHKGQPLFEKLMLRAGLCVRGLRMESTGPWAALERLRCSFELAGCKTLAQAWLCPKSCKKARLLEH